MPPSDLDTSSRDRLKNAVTEAAKACDRLEITLLAWPSHQQGGGHSHPGPRLPWNTAAASLVFELRSHSRRAELSARSILALPLRSRGSSDKNTALALSAIISLAEAAGGEYAHEQSRWLERWHGRAARVLGEASPVTQLPRQPGESPRPCPFCTCLTLRYWPLHGVVRCINPGCRDEEGRRPVAQIEYSGFTQQLELIWQDGVSGLPAPAEQVVA